MNNKSFFLHDKALCESEDIGKNTRIDAFSYILPEASIGDDCNIGSGVLIENDVRIGNRVTLKSGVQIWNGITLEDDVFVGPNVSFTNDNFSRDIETSAKVLRTVVKKGVSLGANSTILPGITIGINAIIGAGAVVTKNIPPNAIVIGNPAKIIGYVNAPKAVIHTSEESSTTEQVVKTSVKGVTIHNLPVVTDIRGNLSVGEFSRTIPFDVKRYFIVYDVPTKETRGEHAHHECHQFLVAIKGIVHVVADDGINRQEFILDAPNKGIHLPPKTWGIQYQYSEDAVLLVFASEYYAADDYIRNYDEFMALV